MAKTSGGVRGNTKGGIKSVRIAESSIRRNNFETAIAFNAKGKELFRVGGKQYSVSISNENMKQLENNILTHNHPRSLGKTGIKGIGNSFSMPDLITAVKANASEVRAVTPSGLTFSMKRPKSGWGASPDKVKNVYKKIEKEVTLELSTRIARRKTTVAKANAVHFHEVNKRIAKQLGWIYSKEK